RRPAGRDEGPARGPARAPLDRLLAADARLRVLRPRAGGAQGRRPSTRAHDPPLEPQGALRRLARLARRRVAGARGPAAPARSHRARDAAAVRVPPRLVRGRSRHLGQPLHDAPRPPLRGHAAPPRAAPGHDAGRRLIRQRWPAAAAAPAGSTIVKRAPRPTPGLLASTRPWSSCTTSRTMASPRPRPDRAPSPWR